VKHAAVKTGGCRRFKFRPSPLLSAAIRTSARPSPCGAAQLQRVLVDRSIAPAPAFESRGSQTPIRSRTADRDAEALIRAPCPRSARATASGEEGAGHRRARADRLGCRSARLAPVNFLYRITQWAGFVHRRAARRWERSSQWARDPPLQGEDVQCPAREGPRTQRTRPGLADRHLRSPRRGGNGLFVHRVERSCRPRCSVARSAAERDIRRAGLAALDWHGWDAGLAWTPYEQRAQEWDTPAGTGSWARRAGSGGDSCSARLAASGVLAGRRRRRSTSSRSCCRR